MKPITTLLSKQHNRKDFHCGKTSLDEYIRNQVSQDIRKKLAVCFILEAENQSIKGFYTLSNASIPLDLVPEKIKKTIPRAYPNLPTTLLGRLAIDNKYAKKGLGKLLLIDALRRSYENSVNSLGSMAVIVDPLDDTARHFYEKYGFITLPTSEKMFLPMKTIRQLFI